MLFSDISRSQQIAKTLVRPYSPDAGDMEMFELVWPVPTTKVLVSAVAATELSCAAPHDAC